MGEDGFAYLRNAGVRATFCGVLGQQTEKAELLKKIGELTIERDFLSDGLGRSR